MGIVAKIASVAPIGFNGRMIEVECDITNGLPSFQVVGLANKSVDEAKERVKSAIANSLLEYPKKHITINLAPAELPKTGTHYDLPIALSILLASGQLRKDDLLDSVFAGELALDGSLRPIAGSISIAESAQISGAKYLYMPIENTQQASLVKGIEIIGVKTLKDIFLHLKKERCLTSTTQKNHSTDPGGSRRDQTVLLDDICDQEQAKRALLIAAAGRHNLLLSGPPGAGKSMLGKTLASLLPDLSPIEQLAVTKLYSLAGENIDSVVRVRPFRSPHHTSSRVAIIGGGSHPLPGEVSLAHHGVLFLDEAPEYPRSTLEALRQPLEDQIISVSRANGRAVYPANFMLVATMNPCPCGYFGDSRKECNCSQNQISAYQKRLSGPLVDRIDMKLTVSRVPHDKLLKNSTSSDKQHISFKKLVERASKIQHKRYGSSDKYNSNATNNAITSDFCLSAPAGDILIKAANSLDLSARSTFKTLKVARTIADIESSKTIEPIHITEALQYR